MADVSGAMLERKVSFIESSGADTIITGDASCLTQMNGGLSRAGSVKRVRHLADVLADGLKTDREA
jgi:L-lactate dehydrogenase complex protein LldE